MTKRGTQHPDQLGFDFSALVPADGDAGLAGLDKIVARKVARALKEDPRDRYQIAAAMSALLDDDVSKTMLDAYSSEGRETHNISLARALALFAVTSRVDLLDRLLRRIGVAALCGEELQTARLGHLKAQERALRDEIRRIERAASPISRGTR